MKRKLSDLLWAIGEPLCGNTWATLVGKPIPKLTIKSRIGTTLMWWSLQLYNPANE